MAHLEWYYDEETTNRIVVRSSTVNQDTLFTANLIAAIAYSRLAVHHANNYDDPRADSSVSVTAGKVDAFANLDDPDGGALPIALSLGLFAPFAFSGAIGPERLARTREQKVEKRKRLGKRYGKK